MAPFPAMSGERWRISKTWLALLSVVWIAAFYALWIALHSPNGDSVLLAIRAQCDQIDDKATYLYAECTQLVSQRADRERSDVAGFAALIAILPVAVFWGLWLAHRFVKACRDDPNFHPRD